MEYYVEKYGEEKGVEEWLNRLKQLTKSFTHNNGLNKKCSIILKNNGIPFEKEFPLFSKDKWEYDKRKCEFDLEKGYKILTIWEDEFSEKKLLTLLKENGYGNCKN